MNAPDRHEFYTLQDGEKPVEIVEDTKIPNAATIKVVKQDHTLANMIRAQLLSMPQILFAGYKVPHPLQPYFLIKIQTDGSLTPVEALEAACTKLIALISTLEAKFRREFSFKDAEGGLGVGVAGAGPSGGAITSTSASAGTVSGATGTVDDPYGTGGWTTGKDYLDF